MSNLIKAWRSALADKLNMAQAAWEPFTQSLHIGDFGEFKDGVFERRNASTRWGVDTAKFAMRIEESGSLEISQDVAFEVDGGGGGSGGGASVSAMVRFGSEQSFLLRAPWRKVIEVEDPEAFGRAVYDAAKAAGEAPKLMTYLIYGVVIVRQAYFLGSMSANTACGVRGGHDEVMHGAVSGSLSFTQVSSEHIAVMHPGDYDTSDFAVIAFKVLSWSPTGNRVQLDANT